MDLSALLLSGLTGAATGYITNDVAVRMLFRSFGPFGGVLESTREEFIVNMSQLVEDEIINYETISGELENPRVREEINRFITEVISVQLQEKFEGICWYELPGWEQSSRGLRDMVAEEEFISDLLAAGADNIELSDLISEEQLENVMEKLLNAGAEILQQDEVAEDLAELLAGVIINLHSPGTAAELTEEELLKLQKKLSAHRGRLKRLLEELLTELDISSRAEEEISKLLDRPLADWFENSSLAGSGELLIDFLEKPEGEDLFRDIVRAVGSALEEVELTLPELLGDSWQRSVLPLLEKRLPEILEALLAWLEENRKELEAIIDESIEEVLSAGSGLRNRLKNILFRALQGNVARRYGLLNRIIQNMSRDRDRTRLAHQFTRQLAGMLEEKTVGWFFYRLKELEVVDWRLLHQLLLQFLQEGDMLTEAGEITLPSLKPADFIDAEKFSSRLALFLPGLAADFSVNLLLLPGLSRSISSALHDHLPNYLGSERGVDGLKSLLKSAAGLLEEGRVDDGLLHRLNPLLYERMSALGLGHLLQPLPQEDIISSLQEISSSRLSDILHDFSDGQITDMLDRILDIPDYQNRLTDFSLELLEDNLSLLLEDRISQAVSDNLLDLSVEDMRRVVEEFMGRELKPLTYFGGLLGLIAGLLLETAGGGLMAAAGGTTRLGISMLVYGLVGFLTNVTAIRMIFRPYGEYSFAGRRLPFTPGLIARNQKRFATALGEFVEEDLLNPRRMSRLFQQNRSQLESVLSESLSRDDYRSLRMVLRISSDSFAARLQRLAKNQLSQNSSRAGDLLAAGISSNLTAGRSLQRFSTIMENYAAGRPDEFRGALARIFAGAGEADMSFARLLSGSDGGKTVLNLLDLDLSELSRSSDIIAELITELTEALGTVSAEDLISRPRQKQLEEFFLARLLQFLRGEKLGEFLRSLEDDLFEGSLPQEILEIMPDLVSDNLSSLLDVILERIISFLSAHRENIKDMAADIVEEEIERSEAEEGLVGGLLMKGAYRLTDGRGTIRDIIDDLIDNRLPPYMQQSREEIGSKLEPVLVEVSGEISRELLSDSDPAGWAELAAEISSRPAVVENLQRFVHRFSSLLWRMEFSPAVLPGGFERISSGFLADIAAGFRPDSDKEAEADRLLADLLEIQLRAIREQLTPARLLAALTGRQGEDMREIESLLTAGDEDLIRPAADFFSSTARFIEMQESDLQDVLSSPLLSEDILAEDIGQWLDQIEQHDQFNSDIETALADFLHRSSARLPRFLSPATVDFVLGRISEAGLDGLEIHFQSLLEAVAVKETAVREVEEMDPAAIEELFQSFAGRYLNRLKFYGLSGSFFGLLAELFTFMTPG